ncbi:MAG: hypothetical protein U0637_09930 [Phycisphaerales bacterium]
MRRAGAAVLTCALLASCAGTPSTTHPPAARGQVVQAEAATAVLERLAARQRSTPDAGSRALAPIPGLADAPPAPLADAERAPGSNASMPLADAVAKLGATLPAPQPWEDAADEDAHVQSVKLYASGRSALLAGEVAAGLRDLEAALRLSPGNPELLAALADAQLRTGRRATGMATLRRAFEAGQRAPRSMWLIARDALRAGRREEALPLLASAWGGDELRTDPALELIVGADLGEVLAQQGYAAASAEALSRALTIAPDTLPRSPSLADTAEVFRRRGELRTIEGDQRMLLGDADGAIAAYRFSAQTSSVDPAGALSRTVQSLALAGRPAEAALELLKDIEARHGALDERHAQLARYLAQPPAGIADVLARAISERSAQIEGSTLSTRLAMSRLAAACQASLPEPSARVRALDVLRSSILQQGPDALLLGDALDLTDTAAASQDFVRGVVAQDVLSADACAEALVEHGRWVDENLAALRSAKAPTDRLVASGMLRRAGRPEDALAVLAQEPQDPALQRGWRAMKAMALSDLGRADDAAALAFDLTQTAGDASVLGRAVRSADDLAEPEAIHMVLRCLAGPPDVVALETRRAAAVIAAATQRGSLADELLKEAQHLDDRSEETYELLLALYSPGGGAPDSSSFTDTLRSLRQAQPGSALVRRLVALDLVQKGLSRQAQPQLLALVDGRGQPPAALAALVEAWERSARGDPQLADQGERWLRERLDARPQSPALLLALTRLLVANGKAGEADERLAARTAAWPAPALLRQREFVLRDGLGRPGDADEMALERLRHSPGTFDTRLERAAALLKAKRVEEAAGDLAEAVKRGGTPLRAENAARIGQLLASIPPGSVEQQPAEAIDALLACVTPVRRALSGEAATSTAIAGVRLLAAGKPGNTDAIVSAIDALRSEKPELGELAEAEARKVLFGARVGAKDPSEALHLLATLALRAPDTERRRFVEWLLIAVYVGDVDDLSWFLDRVTGVNKGALMLQAFEEEYESKSRGAENMLQPTTLDEYKSEIARIFADEATVSSRDVSAAGAHRLALKYRPAHPWVSNDFGYAILERGGDIQEAARLIEQAYSQLSDHASVTDSLGWLRYKQGLLEDDQARVGDVCQGMGAVTLLTRAVKMEGGESNAEVIEHLGDALWRWNNGNARQEARAQWGNAVTQLQYSIKEAVAFGLSAGDPRLKASHEDLDRLQQKVADADAGKEPLIAPVGIPPTFSPRPVPPLAGSEQSPPQGGVESP